MAEFNRQMVLAARPNGMVDGSTVVLSQGPVPEPAEGEALVRVQWLTIDPTIRTWMNDAPGYLPPIAIGETVRSGGIGQVLASRSDRYAEGDLVFGMVGWQDYALAGDGGKAASPSMQVLPDMFPPPVMLNVLGVTGMTAYFGLLDVGRPVEGDTVVVSGAAGATGSMVGQIAKLRGAGTVVGIAGGEDKCRWVTDAAGFDAAIDYRTEDVGRRLRELCPKGIDIYFDNVGGDILNACLARLAMKGRVVVCGAISSYNESGPPPGPSNYTNLIIKRGRMEGFLVFDYADRYAEAQAALAGWLLEGKLAHAEHVVEGLEHAPEALNLLFTGGNTGKVIVKV